MRRHSGHWAITVGVACCVSGLSLAAEKPTGPKRIGDITSVEGFQSFPVQGVGLVVGLKNTGSDPAPGPDRASIQLEMQKRSIPKSKAEAFLRDPATALVRIRAMVPAGVRSCKSNACWCTQKHKNNTRQEKWRPHLGEAFDVELEVPSRDLTSSLESGWLLEAWLYEVASVGTGALTGHVVAKASGPIVVSPGKQESVNLRRGVVLSGGVAKKDRDFALMTDGTHREARWTMQIGHRINTRFPASKNLEAFAEPKDARRISVRVPHRYRNNTARYFEVLGRIPVFETPNAEVARIAQLEKELLAPSTSRRSAIELEGIGRRGGQMLKIGLESDDADVRFFSAEALAYLGDRSSAETLASTAREIVEYRAHALVALSVLDEPVSRIKLLELIRNSESVELRIGAFRALQAMDEFNSDLHRQVLGNHVNLYEIESAGSPFVHISTRGRPEIVLFGRQPELLAPVILKIGPDILLTGSKGGKDLIFSKIVTNKPTQHLPSKPQISQVIAHAIDLGASYSGVWGMLADAEKFRNLSGRLVLDAGPDPRRIYPRLRSIRSVEPPPAQMAMPNLFRWLEAEKTVESGVAAGDETASEERNYITGKKKRSLLDRLLRRKAN